MIPEDLQALVLGDAVGALNPDERVELEARLVDLSPDQRSEVASLYETATVLAMSVNPSTLRPLCANACWRRPARRRVTRCGVETQSGSKRGSRAFARGC